MLFTEPKTPYFSSNPADKFNKVKQAYANLITYEYSNFSEIALKPLKSSGAYCDFEVKQNLNLKTDFTNNIFIPQQLFNIIEDLILDVTTGCASKSKKTADEYREFLRLALIPFCEELFAIRSKEDKVFLQALMSHCMFRTLEDYPEIDSEFGISPVDTLLADTADKMDSSLSLKKCSIRSIAEIATINSNPFKAMMLMAGFAKVENIDMPGVNIVYDNLKKLFDFWYLQNTSNCSDLTQEEQQKIIAEFSPKLIDKINKNSTDSLDKQKTVFDKTVDNCISKLTKGKNQIWDINSEKYQQLQHEVENWTTNKMIAKYNQELCEQAQDLGNIE